VAVGSPPTVRRRQLGRELRKLREGAGLHIDQLAGALRCSPSRISRIETARIRIAPGTVHEILDVLGVQGEQRGRLVALAREAEQPGWWQAYSDSLTYEYATYIALESEASRLRIFEPMVVHGLLQTEAYTRAVVEQWSRHQRSADVEALVAARMARQAALVRPDPLAVHILLDEAVLHHVVGAPEVLEEQLRHLMAVAGRSNIRLQVIPFGSARVMAVLSGPVVVLDFPEPDLGSIMFLENFAGDLYVERGETLRRYLEIFEDVAADALSEAHSLDLISRLLGRPHGAGSR
jgi:transcriptional regulator with XRE-family HTH domain